MTPLTKEQAEALADRIEARAFRTAGIGNRASAATLERLATEIRDGTFIEVQHD